MGALLRTLEAQVDADAPGLAAAARLALFSQSVNDANSAAAVQALLALLEPDLRRLSKSGARSVLHIPIEASVAGGDDLIAVLPGELALVFAAAYMTYFQRQFQAKWQEGSSSTALRFGVGEELLGEAPHLCSSVGVVIAHAQMPIRHLLTMAKDLLRSAKRLSWSRRDEADDAALDFRVITGSDALPLAQERRENLWLESEGALLTMRPYRRSEFIDLLIDAGETHGGLAPWAGELLRSLSGSGVQHGSGASGQGGHETIGAGRWKAILEASTLGPFLGMIQGQYLLARIHRREGPETVKALLRWARSERSTLTFPFADLGPDSRNVLRIVQPEFANARWANRLMDIIEIRDHLPCIRGGRP